MLVDYTFDVCVKRMMSLPPGEHVRGIFEEVKVTLGREGFRRTYRGAGVKAVEFGISYAATGFGAMAVYRIMGGGERG